MQRKGCTSIPEIKDLAQDDPVWELVVHYMAALCVNIILLVSPERITIGGGIMQNLSLFPLIRARVQSILDGYIQVSSSYHFCNH